MKVSIIVPCFNEEKFLDKCLESISNQTIKADEVIVVDNNSTDKTSSIAKKHGAIVMHESRQGLTYARNAGFNHAKGEILVKTDADTTVPSDWVERIKKHFEDQKVGRVTGSAVFYSKYLDPLFNFLVFWVNDIFGYKALLGPNYAIRKWVWDAIKSDVHLEDNKFHEDLDLAIHSSNQGKYVRDLGLKVTTSSRRAGNPKSLFIDYHIKWRNTVFLKDHRKHGNFVLRLKI